MNQIAPPRGITFGYARVSTAEQRLDLQLEAFKAAGVHQDYIYSEHVSGVKKQRPQLAECLRLMRHGDTLVVWKLDRLGRSTRELIDNCTSTHQVFINEDRRIFVDGTPQDGRNADTFAQADGFKDEQEMIDWFGKTHGLPFEGSLIKWDKPASGNKDQSNG